MIGFAVLTFVSVAVLVLIYGLVGVGWMLWAGGGYRACVQGHLIGLAVVAVLGVWWLGAVL